MASEPVQRIAAEAEDARANIAITLDAIQDRLDPRRIVSDAVERATDTGRQLATQASDALRAHPLALGAAVAAVGVALLARNRLANATVNLGDDLGGYTDYDDGFGFGETKARATGDAEDDDRRLGLASRVPEIAARASDGVAANPLVSIVVGLAAGAALGALFPTSEAERRTLGDVGDRIAKALQG
jgi:ElaB/YqjD/DUF883 family membrane-anchored ribosome-binding protein